MSERPWPPLDSKEPIVPGEWPLACLGPGRVGSALTRALSSLGCPVVAVGGGTGEWAARLAAETGAEVVTPPWTGLGERVRLVLVTVPDRFLGEVAEQLGREAGLRGGTLLLQASATEPADVLRAAAGAPGCACLSFHPLRPFPDRAGDESAFRGVFTALEGDEPGLLFGHWLADALGARSVRIAAADKTLYHAAGVMSATGLIALARAAARIAGGLDLPGDFVAAAVVPGMRAALEGLERHGLPRALTGPVMRGDDGVVARHLEALRRLDPRLAELYRVLLRLNLENAAEAGLDEEGVERLRRLLED
jgi:predicted short-subunit dehydrogenase-like oxidoreductase (DUF2520 family)